MKSPRVDYNKIAAIYDTDHHRGKAVDPELLAFLAEHPGLAPTILDVGCGTGSQLAANHAALGRRVGWLVGLDLFGGMLLQAQQKAVEVAWLQGNGETLPFKSASFDFITNQFSFHHVHHKAALLAEAFRLLRPGGRLVLTNISPRETRNWAIYRYFPAALAIDWQDFMPDAEIQDLLKQVGFHDVRLKLTHLQFEQPLATLAETIRLRVVSQLLTISEADYQAGLRQIEQELSQGQPATVASELCLAQITGEKFSQR